MNDAMLGAESRERRPSILIAPRTSLDLRHSFHKVSFMPNRSSTMGSLRIRDHYGLNFLWADLELISAFAVVFRNRNARQMSPLPAVFELVLFRQLTGCKIPCSGVAGVGRVLSRSINRIPAADDLMPVERILHRNEGCSD